MTILRTLLNGEALDHHGEFYDLAIEPPSVSTVSRRCPDFYFGGMSEPAREAAAAAADVFLMWPDTMDAVTAMLADMRQRADRHGRTLRFGYRCHVIVRETEAEARDAARRLVSKLDPVDGERIRQKSLDTSSVGVSRQAELRDTSDDDGFIEDSLWTGVARARSGAGAAIVGDPDQVRATLRGYEELGIDTFILSGYPHLEECDRFASMVLEDYHSPPL
ncbi:UNVERIFIED_CONTAM: hypothetical protein GTU68_031501 [Idotea baltica]|nr:hypothetical protein [Idotea baltica]